MNFVNSSGTVVSEENFRAMNPLTSFPALITQADLDPYGMSVIQPAPVPPFSPFYNTTEGAPTLVNGVWTQTWTQTAIDIASAQSIQSAAIIEACAAALVAGFSSSALGAPHSYPSSLVDQQNLNLAVTLSLSAGTNWTTFTWCLDSSGNWAFLSHTAVQIQQVANDWMSTRDGLRSKNAQLQANLKAAATVDAVSAVVWA